ncbi:unnamed protein product [Triticum turgidum subsp. durum]|uniref:Uncharacterized protein n=1 Tax=Triticum turgidum subsp. durum TaxID=4567 RepID=A0A9R0T3K6_TRITD|nr:unnamed protein product [Triticum turgidum subsp. durum]
MPTSSPAVSWNSRCSRSAPTSRRQRRRRRVQRARRSRAFREANPQPQDHGLLHQLHLHDAALGLEDVLHQHHRHHHSEPWITNGFDATRDPFDMLQFSGQSQPCGLLLSSTGARL